MSYQRDSPFYIGKKDLSENITVNISHWSERRQLGQQCKAQMTNLHLTAFSEQVKDNAAMFEQRNATLVLGKILPEHIKKKTAK